MNTKVHPPPIEWKFLESFPLKNLKKTFKVADFERKASAGHVNEILQAILHNKFYDIVIRVVKNNTGSYALIDAQHRLQALWLAHELHGVETYPLMLAIYDSKFARVIYRRLNMGRSLLTRDHSKALDDGKVPFFNELRNWAYHERRPNKMSYLDLLHAAWYSKGSNKAVSSRDIDRVLKTITKKDIVFCMKFAEAISTYAPKVFQNKTYNAHIFRNVFKVSQANDFKKGKIEKLLELASTNKKIKEIVIHPLSTLSMNEVYKIVNDELLPKVK